MVDDPQARQDAGAVPGDAAASPDLGVRFPIVGIGASAGGLDALTQLLQALPPDTGMGFVIIQHLSPTHVSSLAEILARVTTMPVCEVRDEPVVEPDHVYIIPPGRDMSIAGGKLHLEPQARPVRPRGIDQFFRGLAADCGHRSIGVVLSGALDDGTVGLEAIKAEGGITFAQDETAQHASMPRSAVTSGCVDFVLPPAEIALEIARIAKSPMAEPEQEGAVEEPFVHARIADIVQQATGLDFSYYKPSTLHRRIKRRMLLHKTDALGDYEAMLRHNPAEVEALYQDILIGVTSFFRDPAVFEALSAHVLPKLLAQRSVHAPLRIWTVAASSGEEAYSIAMVFTECAEALGSAVPLQIFATDINEQCISKARAGLYPKSIVQDVSPERLRRFFIEEPDGYRICKATRERIVFSKHNVLADPPFSRIDLISCRNLLIYLQPVLQHKVMQLLHYALNPEGVLWLGTSESPGVGSTLFDAADVRHKFFTRHPGNAPSGAAYRPAVLPTLQHRGAQSVTVLPRHQPRAELQKEAERLLLATFVPPGVVISASMEIVQYRGDTGAYLSPSSGTPTQDLLKMLREGLLVGVRSAILRAGETGKDEVRVSSFKFKPPSCARVRPASRCWRKACG